jgi:hypothetical protein
MTNGQRAASAAPGLSLVEEEAIIERTVGPTGYREAGGALKRIRDDRKYRPKWASFEVYCQERWDMRRDYAYKLIRAAEATEELYTRGIQSLPATEKVARELKGTKDQKLTAWKATVQLHGPKPTAKQTRTVVKTVVPPKPSKPPRQATPGTPEPPPPPASPKPRDPRVEAEKVRSIMLRVEELTDKLQFVDLTVAEMESATTQFSAVVIYERLSELAVWTDITLAAAAARLDDVAFERHMQKFENTNGRQPHEAEMFKQYAKEQRRKRAQRLAAGNQ